MKWDINSKLRQFNGWLDSFILEIVKPFAMLGLIMGTVDLFLRGSLATQWWFNGPWAVVQALTIDGLFFAVWFKLFAARWTKTTWPNNIGLAVIGGILSIVVGLTNGIVSLQQLWNLADSQQAMDRLGISPVDFTVTRAALMVITLVMLAFTYWQKTATNDSSATNEVTTEKFATVVVTEDRQLPEAKEAVGGENVAESGENVTVATNEETVATPLLTIDSPKHDKDAVVAMLVEAKLSGVKANFGELSRTTGRSRSTLRYWYDNLDETVCPLPAPSQIDGLGESE